MDSAGRRGTKRGYEKYTDGFLKHLIERDRVKEQRLIATQRQLEATQRQLEADTVANVRELEECRQGISEKEEEYRKRISEKEEEDEEEDEEAWEKRSIAKLPEALRDVLRECRNKRLVYTSSRYFSGRVVTRRYCSLCNIMVNKHSPECEEKHVTIQRGRDVEHLVELAAEPQAYQDYFVESVNQILQ